MDISGAYSYYDAEKNNPSLLNENCHICNNTIKDAFNSWRLEQLAIKENKDIPQTSKPFWVTGINVEKDLKKYFGFYNKVCPNCDCDWWVCDNCNSSYNYRPPERCPKCGEKFEICPYCEFQNNSGYIVCTNCSKSKNIAKELKGSSGSESILVGFLLAFFGFVSLIFSFSGFNINAGVFFSALMIIGGIILATSGIIRENKISKMEHDERKRLISEGVIKPNIHITRVSKKKKIIVFVIILSLLVILIISIILKT